MNFNHHFSTRVICAGLLVWLLASSTSARLSQNEYRTYTNARFAYSISYPMKLLIAQPEAFNGDGRRFVSTDGKALLIVYGSHNALNEKLPDKFAEEANTTAEHPNRKVTYKVLRADWFVVSGVEGGKIFYQKTFLRGDIFKTFRIEYEEAQKAIYDPVTLRLQKSFKG
jgi:hypothetical protein